MTTQNNNEFLEGESNSRENFGNKFKYINETIVKFEKNINNSDISFTLDETNIIKEFYKEQLKERE